MNLNLLQQTSLPLEARVVAIAAVDNNHNVNYNKK